MAKPTIHITHPEFKYLDSAKTDVTVTWRRFGWTPLPARTPYVEPMPTMGAPAERVSRTLRVAGGRR